MHVALGVHGAPGRDQRLPGHLTAEHPLPVHLRTATAEDVLLDLLQVEQPDQPVDGPLAAGRTVRLVGLDRGCLSHAASTSPM